MDRSRALNTLAEAADLARMLEELMAPNQVEKLATTLGGMRVSIRSLREMIANSHDALAREFINQARSRVGAEEAQRSQATQRKPEAESMVARTSTAPTAMTSPEGSARRDLRSAIDRIVER